ncbi:MAG: hypothetical protein AAB517_02865 [Patescibacteria group bacterium]
MTEFDRKQVIVEVLLEVVKGLCAICPQAGFVGYSLGKLADRLTKRAEELTQEMHRLAR